MFWWTEVFCDRRLREPLAFPIIPADPLVHMITGFTSILFSTLGACYKVDNIGRLKTNVASKLDGCPRRCLRELWWGHHFAGSSMLTLWAGTETLDIWIIDALDKGILLHDTKVFSRRMRIKSRTPTVQLRNIRVSYLKAIGNPPNKVLIWKRLLAEWSLA